MNQEERRNLRARLAARDKKVASAGASTVAKRRFEDAPVEEREPNRKVRRAQKSSTGRLRKVAKWSSIILLVLAVFGPPIVWLGLLGYWYSRDAEYKQLVGANLPYATPTVVPGIVSAQLGKEKPRQLSSTIAWDRKEWVDAANANTQKNHLFDAVVAIEDPSFYTRKYSPDFRGKARAASQCVSASIKHFKLTCPQGGSDLTEQTVKNVLWPKPGRDMWRKLNETGLARVVESTWTREQIITRYVNEAYLGDGQTLVGKGFQSAAQGYLSKDLSQLELYEAALLAAMLPNPNRFSPVLHPQDAKDRRNLVLTKMAEHGFISVAQAADAKQKPVEVRPRNVNASLAPHFGAKVLGSLSQVTGEVVGAKDAAALRIETTLDAQAQQAAYPVFAKAVSDLRVQLSKKKIKSADLEAGFVWVDRQGQVRVYFGSADYTKNQNDHVGVTRRQVGSTFKPIPYGLLVEQGKGDRLWLDAPAESGWPRNFNDSYLGYEIPWQEALWRSKNVIATQVAREVGVQAMAERAQMAGLPKPNADLAAALGSKEATMLEVASMYLMLANGGQWLPMRTVAAVKRVDGTDLPVTYESSRQVFSRATTDQVVAALRQVVADPNGTAYGVHGKVPAVEIFAKTGTTQTPNGKEKDAWFAACTPHGCGVVWVGFDDNRPIASTGGAAAAPIWAAVVSKLYATGRAQLSAEPPAQTSPAASTLPAEGSEPTPSPTPLTAERVEEIMEGQRPSSQPVAGAQPAPTLRPVDSQPPAPGVITIPDGPLKKVPAKPTLAPTPARPEVTPTPGVITIPDGPLKRPSPRPRPE